MGPVTNVVLFDKEVDGVASVRYGNAEAARACVDVRYVSGNVPPTLAELANCVHDPGHEWSAFFRHGSRSLYR